MSCVRKRFWFLVVLLLKRSCCQAALLMFFALRHFFLNSERGVCSFFLSFVSDCPDVLRAVAATCFLAFRAFLLAP